MRSFKQRQLSLLAPVAAKVHKHQIFTLKVRTAIDFLQKTPFLLQRDTVHHKINDRSKFPFAQTSTLTSLFTHARYAHALRVREVLCVLCALWLVRPETQIYFN